MGSQMSQSMFDFIFSGLQRVNLHTALIEACDWDETHADHLIELAADAMRDCPSGREVKPYLKESLAELTTPDQRDIIVELIYNEIRTIAKDIKDDSGVN